MTREFENAKHPEHSEGDKGPRNLKMMTIKMSKKGTRMVMVPMVACDSDGVDIDLAGWVLMIMVMVMIWVV